MACGDIFVKNCQKKLIWTSFLFLNNNNHTLKQQTTRMSHMFTLQRKRQFSPRGIKKCIQQFVIKRKAICFQMHWASNEDQIRISAQQPIALVPGIAMLITSQLSKCRKIQTSALILKNGQYFSFTNKHKVRAVMEFINALTFVSRYGTLKLHPEKGTLCMVLSHSLSQNVIDNNSRYLLEHIFTQTRKVFEYMQFNLYHILYLGGEIDEHIYKLARSKAIRIRDFPDNRYEEIDKLVQIMLKGQRNKKPYILNSRIKEFTTQIALPKKVDRTGTKVFYQKPTGYMARDNDLKGSSKEQINQGLRGYQKYLNQEVYKRNIKYKLQRLQIYSQIVFLQPERGIDWVPIISLQNSRISRGKCDFHYARITTADKQQPVKWVKDGQMITKMLAMKQNTDSQKTESERMILRTLKNRTSCYIPKFYQVLDIKPNRYSNSIIMDFYAESSAELYIQHNARTISTGTKNAILTKVVQGMRFLRDSNIVHMDMKFQNVLIGRDLMARISDFGDSYYELTPSHLPTSRCSLPYTPPDYCRRITVRPKCSYDTYSFGVMLDYIFIGRHMFPLTSSALLKMSSALENCSYPRLISLSVQKYLSILPAKVARLIILLVLMCLDPDPQKRPNQDFIVIALNIVKKALDDDCFYVRLWDKPNETEEDNFTVESK